MSLVVDLSRADGAPSLADVGGKARSLSLLLRAGLPVPPAWCITTAAYRAVIRERLDPVITALAQTDARDRAGLAALAREARHIVEDTEVPQHLAEDIAAACAALGGPVAVRSSATAEDLEEASFAGLQDTFLHVIGLPAVVDAVRNCWASLWSDRAVAYRADQGIDPASVALAVVVQQMVEAEAAGVMFTADPVTGTRGRSVIEAARGLGESVVSGAVDPDRFVADAYTGAVLQRRLGSQSIAVRARPGGGTERVQLTAAPAPSLTDQEIGALARLGRDVENLYGAPQDIEWARDGRGTLWLTQSRPITTLYPLVQRPDLSGLRVFLCLSLAQGLTRPLTPIGHSAFRLIAGSVFAAAGRPVPEPLVGPAALRVAGGRPYLDVTGVLRHRLGRRLMLAVLGVMESRAAVVLTRLAGRAEFSLQPIAVRPLVASALHVAHRTRLPLRVLVALLAPRSAYRALSGLERSIPARLALPADAPAAERLDLVIRHLGSRTFLIMPSTAGYAAAGFLSLALARRLLHGIARPGELQRVLRGLPHNPTTEMDLALWAMSDRVRRDEASRSAIDALDNDELSLAYQNHALPPVLAEEMTDFLGRYGHRAVAEIDLGLPRWREDPAHLFGAVRNYLRLEDDALSPAAQFAAAATEADTTVADLVERAARRSRIRARLVAVALRRARALAGLRETPKFLLILTLAALRGHLRAVGEALVARGLLDAVDDVYFCTLPEVRRGLAGESLQDTVAAHRTEYDRELRRRHVPRLLLSDGTDPEAESDQSRPEGALTGYPASAGTVTARARVVLDPRGAHLEPGEVLVAPSTDPGWTPLFLTAAALVMEMGGANSHGAVVAREYGIPAVVGLPRATERIATGDLVIVDGAAGTVVVLEPAAGPGSSVESPSAVRTAARPSAG